MTKNRLILLVVGLLLSSSSYAAGGNGFAMSASVAAAGGPQMTPSSSLPAIAGGVEIGAHLGGPGLFVGAFGDRFNSDIWQAGITGRQYFGGKKLFWVQIKVNVSGMAGMIGSNAESKTWSNYLNGGLGLGMRIQAGNKLSFQPFAEYNSFIPVLGTQRVQTSPTESSLEFVTGSRCSIPAVGLRVALEF